MGLLDGLLGGGMRRGGMSPLTMALLGLLAYKTMKGKNLSDMFGGGAGGQAADPVKADPLKVDLVKVDLAACCKEAWADCLAEAAS